MLTLCVNVSREKIACYDDWYHRVRNMAHNSILLHYSVLVFDVVSTNSYGDHALKQPNLQSLVSELISYVHVAVYTWHFYVKQCRRTLLIGNHTHRHQPASLLGGRFAWKCNTSGRIACHLFGT